MGIIGLPVVIPANRFVGIMFRLIPLFTTAKAAARPSVGKPTSEGGRFSDSPFGRAARLPVVIPPIRARLPVYLPSRGTTVPSCCAANVISNRTLNP